MVEWKTIDGFENYEVSNEGEVRNKLTNKILIGDVNNIGYRRVALHNEHTPPRKGKRFFIHKLVAYYFVKGYEEDLVVNHLDGNKKNNKASNLEWTTRSGNDKHAYTLGLREPHKECKAVYKIDAYTNSVLAKYPSIKEASKENNINATGICRACKDASRIYKGFKWKYAD